jgi:radical SAM superfamily enzyme YgiQ (UPF0313 family)
MRVLLVSTYELGHQPLHVASPAAALRSAGHEVRALDTSVQEWDPHLVAWAEAIAFSVPMHTAMRLAVGAARAVRGARPELPICLYGLYAPVSRDTTLGPLADRLIAGEYEDALVAWVDGLSHPTSSLQSTVHLRRTRFLRPARDLLPPLDRYARLIHGDTEVMVGYVETSHGCAHRCRHCPVPVVYDGRIRIVDIDAVVADVAQLVEAGARHITFGDPDFLNGVHHSLRVARAVHSAFPYVTFDCTAKVEHILRHEHVWAELAGAGCLFVVSAFESTNDEILARLDKGHTAADATRAIALLRDHGIEIRPSFLPFTPWTTRADLVDLLDFVAAQDLVDNVDPVQYAIRLLLPEGSLLLDHPDIAAHIGPYDAKSLGYTWTAADPSVDAIHARLALLVEDSIAAGETIATTFSRVRREVDGRESGPVRCTTGRPRLSEPWFCCAEPTDAQLSATVP